MTAAELKRNVEQLASLKAALEKVVEVAQSMGTALHAVHEILNELTKLGRSMGVDIPDPPTKRPPTPTKDWDGGTKH